MTADPKPIKNNIKPASVGDWCKLSCKNIGIRSNPPYIAAPVRLAVTTAAAKPARRNSRMSPYFKIRISATAFLKVTSQNSIGVKNDSLSFILKNIVQLFDEHSYNDSHKLLIEDLKLFFLKSSYSKLLNTCIYVQSDLCFVDIKFFSCITTVCSVGQFRKDPAWQLIRKPLKEYSFSGFPLSFL